MAVIFFFFNDTATTEIYTLSLPDALPIWDGPEPPHGFARRSLVTSDKPTNPPVAARDSSNNHVLDDQGGHSRAIVLRLLRHYDFPHYVACSPIQGDQMRIIGHHKYLIPEDSHAP